MRKDRFEVRLREYIDAQVPIIYIDSFDDNKIDELILQVTGSRRVWEWNEMDGCVDRKKVENGKYTSIHSSLDAEKNLYEWIRYGVREEEFDRKILIIKDIHTYLEDPKLVALLKNACLRIEAGVLETTFIFISPMCRVRP